MVASGGGGETGVRRDTTISCGGRECAIGALPFGWNMFSIAQCSRSSTLERMFGVEVVFEQVWTVVERHLGVWQGHSCFGGLLGCSFP